MVGAGVGWGGAGGVRGEPRRAGAGFSVEGAGNSSGRQRHKPQGRPGRACRPPRRRAEESGAVVLTRVCV